MNTGEGDIGGLGRIHTWQSSAHTDAFEGECGKVREIKCITRVFTMIYSILGARLS